MISEGVKFGLLILIIGLVLTIGLALVTQAEDESDDE